MPKYAYALVVLHCYASAMPCHVGWHDFPESLKFHNFTTSSHALGPKDYRKSKFSKIFDRLALPNPDWNLCTMAI